LNEVDKAMLTVSEVADYLRLSKSMAYELTRRAGFPCLRIGRKVLVPADGLKAWIESQIQTS
jgi:excisionase family DNA binding protein